jgi:hypothetical protein
VKLPLLPMGSDKPPFIKVMRRAGQDKGPLLVLGDKHPRARPRRAGISSRGRRTWTPLGAFVQHGARRRQMLSRGRLCRQCVEQIPSGAAEIKVLANLHFLHQRPSNCLSASVRPLKRLHRFSEFMHGFSPLGDLHGRHLVCRAVVLVPRRPALGAGSKVQWLGRQHCDRGRPDLFGRGRIRSIVANAIGARSRSFSPHEP